MVMNLDHPHGVEGAMQAAVRAGRLEILVREMSTCQTIVNSKRNRVLSILLAAIAEQLLYPV